MGCSASRPNTNIITRTHNCNEDPHYFSSVDSSMVSSLHSPSSSPPPAAAVVVSRALSLPTPLVHHPPLRKGDSHHLVSLTSTTYGSLSFIDIQRPEINTAQGDDSPVHVDQVESLSPDSVINTWELMDGLDDCGDFDLGKPKSLFNTRTKVIPSLTKPLWKHLSEDSLLSKLPNVVSSYRRALSSRQLVNESKTPISMCSSSPSCTSSLSDSWVKVPTTESKIVLYFTSLRGIRKTYEDCCCVKTIFRGFRVAVDERDISMDSMYRNELQSLLGGKTICLPQVFIRGKHIGGVEEIKQLNENGELSRLLEGFPVRDPGVVCEGCGDARFVPCPNCNGSRKVFEEDVDRLRRCPDCNENGLIRCPACCSS
ncbi:hypothetical protein F3Y22_tig00004041pilonHSYRG00045 [Hibiscus syriacus]|uniref:Glutaredoxin domain-containing protein n=1 Tax=Hibiscus syriacus TaxID=106335 RepID=A0A6A3CI03_HIBSY|nr:uncharacterized protein At5g39865-like [Hibiscus syriacus]KAE8728940.1 hypothetical protein F3Y22_tig00004041pilonHSYRG00045 [Hibiscus syriacus]